MYTLISYSYIVVIHFSGLSLLIIGINQIFNGKLDSYFFDVYAACLAVFRL